ncbi:hypothetical protein DFP94_110133 [Fontibacillus phaseoli]|uniref:ESAT-6 protein secretion system EspG family protein n=1 Tax=Fontibacillus phaseoli TaxID=1416533 RepID=A0A369B6K9_9BACL|nr:hypothetical protein [Fontibacillus phaseoli]RCX17071.1 hypothetical protein DFP94_110133 [Fontibacillus phaseoli]
MIITDTSPLGAVTLESKELYYLADLLGADCLDGTESPFRGYLQGGMDEDREEVQESLIMKGVINRAANGMMITQQMFSSLAAVLFSDKACWMKYQTGTQTFEEFLHITNERVVALERLPENSSLHRVDEIGCVSEACGMLAGKMKWNRRTPGELPALMLSRRQFAEIVAHLDKLELEEILSELSKVSDDQEGIIALAKCMKTSISHGDLQFFARKGERWESQRAQFINNHHMNWLIRASSREEEDWLIATPTPNEKFQEMLQLWFRQPSSHVEDGH